jgi:isoquinoline 1-oxidoreductase beta subunit
MEPPAAVVDASRTPVRVWASTQAPMETRQYVAEALGIDMSDVQCEITLLGGGFGRKSKCDFSYEAALISKQINAPVRIQWTREDDIQHGFYHAVSAQYLKAGMDEEGRVIAWQQNGSWPSFFSLWNPALHDPSDLEMGLGLIDLPYNSVPNIRIQTGEAEAMIRIGWYRSVNNIQHAFAMNGFVAELANASGRDFLEVMLELIGNEDTMDVARDSVENFWNYGDSVEEWPVMPKRLANALRVVAEKSGYGKTSLPKGQAIGLACHRSFHSYVATAVRAKIDADGSLSVPRVDVAIDCGRYVNPEGVRKQIEGATVFGHTVARHGKITVRGGAVQQSNFHDYMLSRMSDAPLDVRVHLIEDFKHLRPCGVGEPGVPPYSPALANAIHAITGKRLRSLPLDFA